MINNIKIPAGSIKVIPCSNNEWQFKFRRLDYSVYHRFECLIEDFHLDNLEITEKKLHLLINQYPEYIDAYYYLSLILEKTGRYEEARQILKIAVEIGKSAFPKNFKIGRDKLPWRILDNRSYLYTYHAWGLSLLEEDKVTEALAIFNEILALNPNDNQGIRALAIDCYFRLNQPEKVLEICKLYPDEIMEEVVYGKPLALLQLGREAEALDALQRAVQILPNVAKELLKKTHRQPKNLNPQYVTQGGADQAYFYWRQSGKYWSNTKGALELLASVFRE